MKICTAARQKASAWQHMLLPCLKGYGQLADMMQEYAGTDVSKTYGDELTRIQSELQALGIGRVDKNGTFAVTENSIVPTIELQDLEYLRRRY